MSRTIVNIMSVQCRFQLHRMNCVSGDSEYREAIECERSSSARGHRVREVIECKRSSSARGHRAREVIKCERSSSARGHRVRAVIKCPAMLWS